MKPITSFIMCILAFMCSAQKASDHMMFMGLPLAGSAEYFIPRLEEKGFVKTDEFESTYSFYGKFANEIVRLTLLASPKTRTICKVIVYFPKKDSWSDLKKDYFTKKALYRSKYLLNDDFEFFSNPYDEGDGYELQAVSRDKCKYCSFFKDLYGGIVLEVCPDKCIKISYEDTENMKVAQQELESKAFDDI